MNKVLSLLIVGVFLLSGCKKELTTSTPTKERFGIESFQFEYLTAKAKLKYEDGNQKLGLTANFRIKKDSIIWVSLSPGLGLEAARMVVTSTGVEMLDKIKREYYSYDYASLSKQYGFEITFQLAEALVVGNVLFSPEKKKQMVADGRFNTFAKEESGFGINHFIGKSSGKLERLHAYQLETENSIVVNYSDFEKIGEQQAPQKIRARITFEDKTKEDAVIDIEYSRSEISDETLTFPFNVPDNYKKK